MSSGLSFATSGLLLCMAINRLDSRSISVFGLTLITDSLPGRTSFADCDSFLRNRRAKKTDDLVEDTEAANALVTDSRVAGFSGRIGIRHRLVKCFER